MKVIYDPKVDAMHIFFNDNEIDESDEDKPGVIIDYDKTGNLVGIEILDASKRMVNPMSFEYMVTK